MEIEHANEMRKYVLTSFCIGQVIRHIKCKCGTVCSKIRQIYHLPPAVGQRPPIFYPCHKVVQNVK